MIVSHASDIPLLLLSQALGILICLKVLTVSYWAIIGNRDEVPHTVFYQIDAYEYETLGHKFERRNDQKLNITISTVACGHEHLELATSMLKSALLFSLDTNLHVVVFTDQEILLQLKNALLDLQHKAKRHFGYHGFTYEVRLVTFPSYAETGVAWESMHLKCTNQRLFFPSLLPHIDAFIYLDTDVLVFGSLSDMWREFEKMSEEQSVGATQNSEFFHLSMYNSTKGHPYFGPRGLNAGIMLMNLTRMRQQHTQQRAVTAYKDFWPVIYFADQDIYNIIFHETPSQVYTLSCIYNILWVHCPWKSKENKGKNRCRWAKTDDPDCFCSDALKRGLYIIHGNYRTFSRDFPGTTNSLFPWIYAIFKEVVTNHLKPLKQNLESL